MVETGRNKLFWNCCICCTHAGCLSAHVTWFLSLSQRYGTKMGLGCPAEGFPVYVVKQYSFVGELQNHLNGLGVVTKPNSSPWSQTRLQQIETPYFSEEVVKVFVLMALLMTLADCRILLFIH